MTGCVKAPFTAESHAAKRTQQQERGQAEVLPGEGDGDPGPRRREAGEVRAPDNTERMTHDHKRHEQRHLQRGEQCGDSL